MTHNTKCRYRKVNVKLSADPRYRKLSRPLANGQSCYLYLKTGPHTTNIPGVFQIGEAALAECLGWTIEGFRQAYCELQDAGLAEADFISRLIWLPDEIHEDLPDNHNIVLGWRVVWGELPDCELKAKIRQTFRDVLKKKGSAFAKAFSSFAGHDNETVSGTVSVTVGGNRMPNTETEPDPEPEKKKKSCSTSSARKPTPSNVPVPFSEPEESAAQNTGNIRTVNDGGKSEAPEKTTPLPPFAGPGGGRSRDEMFPIFYGAYPRKQHRLRAREVWMSAEKLPGLDWDLLQTMLRALKLAEHAGWGGHDAPLPENWLTGKRWLDVW